MKSLGIETKCAWGYPVHDYSQAQLGKGERAREKQKKENQSLSCFLLTVFLCGKDSVKCPRDHWSFSAELSRGRLEATDGPE